MPDTPKTNHNNMKTWKNKPQKTPFCHVQKQPTIFHQFSVFSTYFLLFVKLCFAENTIKIVFSEKKHSFSKTQLVKPSFSTLSKNTFFKKRVSFLVLANFRWNPYFYSVFWFTLFWSKKHFWPNQIVCTKMRFFFLPDTTGVSQFLLKIHFLFFTLLDDHLKKPIFIGFFGLFHFCFFLSLFLQHKKGKKTPKNIFFSKTSFLTSPKFCKNTILTQCDTICASKHAQKHYKNRENNEIGPIFNLLLGPMFNL